MARQMVRVTRRRHLGWLAALPTAAGLAACGTGTSSTPPDTKTTASTAPARLLWQVRSGTTYEELVKTMLPVFRQDHPNVTVEYVQGSEGNNEKTLTMMVAGDGPDVIQNWPPGIWELSAQGQVQNLNEYVRDLKKADLD